MTEYLKSIIKFFGGNPQISYIEFVSQSKKNQKEETKEEIVNRIKNKLR